MVDEEAAGQAKLRGELERFGQQGNLRAAVRALAAAEVPQGLREGLAELGALAERLRLVGARYDARVLAEVRGRGSSVLAAEALRWEERRELDEARELYAGARALVVEQARLWVTGGMIGGDGGAWPEGVEPESGC